MKKFIRKVILFSSLFLFLWIIIVSTDMFIVKNQYSQNYQASILDKIERAKNIEGRKVILVGNSNVSFAFDSKLLEERTGIPVVNMGIHSGLGNAFQEDMTKPYIQQGDIVVLCHNSYSDGYSIPDPSLVWITIEKHTDLWKIIREDKRIEMAQAYPLYAFDCFMLAITGNGNKSADSCYDRSSFNIFGDIIYKPEKERKATNVMFYQGAIKVPKISDETIERINAFNDYVLSRGAVLVIAGYPIADGEYTPSKDEYRLFQEELEERVNCPVISDFTDYFIPYELFYNTILHLNEKGTEIRTIQTAADIMNFLGESGE